MQYFRSEYIDFLELRFEQGHKALSILSVEYSEKTAQCSCFKEYFSKFISPLDISGYENSWVAMIRNIRLQAYHLGTQLAIQARRAPIREKLIKLDKQINSLYNNSTFLKCKKQQQLIYNNLTSSLEMKTVCKLDEWDTLMEYIQLSQVYMSIYLGFVDWTYYLNSVKEHKDIVNNKRKVHNWLKSNISDLKTSRLYWVLH